mmetsp:Transcript_1542/g.4004  ORF Transcript_1542/g.4004 Transcript_1542/m.4004 type:complete len:221 (-) Transcript_1542:161-823(-)
MAAENGDERLAESELPQPTSPAEAVNSALDGFTAATEALERHYRQKLDDFRIRESERTEEYEAAIAALETQESELEAELSANEAEVQEEREDLAERKATLEGTHTFTKSKIKLDIGGHRCTTAPSTLLSAKESFLAAMLSGRYELYAEPSDGSYFIDRDGRQFRNVINFLRGGESFECPTKLDELAQLKKDAIFYGLPELADICDKKIAVSRGGEVKRNW